MAEQKDQVPAKEQEQASTDTSRLYTMPKPAYHFVIVLTIIGVLVAIYYMLHLSIGGWVIPGSSYYYIVFALFGCSAFLLMPATPKQKNYVPWFDYVLTALAFIIPMYFALNGTKIALEGWVPAPKTYLVVLSGIYALLMLEMVRRSAGKVFFWICLVFGLYPLVANVAPGVLKGISLPFKSLISYYSFGTEGLLGTPGNITGNILIGFLLFAGLLVSTGAGQFFMDLALALCGRFRGGTAKVAVLTSGFFGMLSGSPISNVVSAGTITIPAMKKSGYPDYFAAGIEAVAATGGVLMPPVMGTLAFVMVIMSGYTYGQVMVAAIVPALLYYFGLFVQVDAYAARSGMKGLDKKDLPKVGDALAEGWFFIIVLIFLVLGLVYFRWGNVTPYYASALLFVLSFFNKRKEYRLTPKRLYKALGDIGKIITNTVAMILPFTFIIAGLVITGLAAAVSTQLVMLGGDHIILVLLLTILACYILGIMGMDIAAYLFFSVSIAPAMVSMGLNKMAVHLFLIYYPMLAMITPPVAVAAFVAASVAGAKPIKTAWQACKLGIVIYFIPLCWIYDPTIIMQGSIPLGILWAIMMAFGAWIMAGALSGYLPFIKDCDSRIVNIVAFFAGLAIMFPHTLSTITGCVAYGVILLLHKTSDGKITKTGKYALAAAEFKKAHAGNEQTLGDVEWKVDDGELMG